jgi:hypothetical protein
MTNKIIFKSTLIEITALKNVIKIKMLTVVQMGYKIWYLQIFEKQS